MEYDITDLQEQELSTAPSLDMPHLVVEAFYLPKNNGPYSLYVTRLDKSYKCTCSQCGSDNTIYDGNSALRLIHDVIRNNRRVDIVLRSPRVLCKDCNKRFVPEIDGIVYDRQMTTRLETYIRKECFLRPFVDIAELTGFSMPTIASIMDEEVLKYDSMRAANPPDAPRVLGIDEKHLSSIMRGTLVDIEDGALLDILPDNKALTMQEGIMALKNWDKNIQVVTTDMNNSYISWLPTILPAATIVVDKFHVIKDLEQSITESRKNITKVIKRRIEAISDPVERSRQESVLRIATSNRRLFNFSIARLMREGDYKKLAKLTTVTKEFPEFKMLHDLHFGIEVMYEQTNREDAEKVWQDWMFLVPPSSNKDYKDWCDLYCFEPECFESFRSFSRKGFQQFVPYILNYFNSPATRVTNAATEGLNSLIENVNIAGKGYSFSHLRAKCLYAPLVHEKLNYGVNMKSVKDQLMYVFNANDLFEASAIPRLNIYSDNSWLFKVLSNDYSDFVDSYKLDYGSDNPAFDCYGNEESIISAFESE
jgi:transposase